MTIEQIRAKLNLVLANREYLQRQVEDERAALKKAQERIKVAEQAQQVLQHVAAAVQNEAHAKIAAVVSMCLETVFDDPYAFQILFEKKRGKTEARLVFVRQGNVVDPMTASGGGAKDVASLALRLARIALAKPKRRRLLVLDEPFANLKSAEYYGPRVVALLERLADEYGMQVLQINNLDAYSCGKVIEI